MATTIQLVAQNLDKLAISAGSGTGKNGIKFAQITYGGQPLTIRLSEDLESVRVPFPPSVYNGDGSEARKSLVYNIPQDVYAGFSELEDFCRQLLEDANPKVQSLWCSMLKPADRWGAQLKAKINISGARPARFYDAAKEPCDAPSEWRGLGVNVVLLVRGVYIQKTGIGLMLETTHLQYDSIQKAVGEEQCPF